MKNQKTEKTPERKFSAEYDRSKPVRMRLSHIKSKLFSTRIIFEKIPDDETVFDLLKQVDKNGTGGDVEDLQTEAFDLYLKLGKTLVSGVEGYLIPDGKTWRDVVRDADISKAFAKLLYVVASPRLVEQDAGELFDPFAPVAMDISFFDNSGDEVKKEISFNPVSRAQLKEFKFIKLDKPNPDALASEAKKHILDRLHDLGKELFHSANYADVPAWHLTQATLQYLQIEQEQGKF